MHFYGERMHCFLQILFRFFRFSKRIFFRFSDFFRFVNASPKEVRITVATTASLIQCLGVTVDFQDLGQRVSNIIRKSFSSPGLIWLLQPTREVSCLNPLAVRSDTQGCQKEKRLCPCSFPTKILPLCFYLRFRESMHQDGFCFYFLKGLGLLYICHDYANI